MSEETVQKRKPGRPPGAKNKPKGRKSKKAETPAPAPDTQSVPALEPAPESAPLPEPPKVVSRPKPPKEAPAPKPTKMPTGFNLLKRGPKIREALQEVLARGEKEARIIVGDPNKPKLLIPVLPFQLQAALKSRGLVSGTILEIIGPESVGKTTLIFTIAGWGMRYNCPFGYFESEAKPMFEDRIRQCLHWDKTVSAAMYDSMYRKEVHDIVSFINEAESWLMQIRDPRNPDTFVPHHIPAIIAGDSWSKLMDPTEAGSFAAYGGPPTNAPKKTGKPGKEKSDKTKAREATEAKKAASKIKDIGTASNLGSAKMAAAWCRRLPHILSTHNAMLIVSRHQSIKIDMNSKPGSFMSPEDMAPYNNNSRGGRAFPQSAAYEFILTASRQIKRVIDKQDVVVGHDIKVNINKNSFGPGCGKLQYRIATAGYRDNDQFQDMSIDFHSSLPDFLKSIGLDIVRYSDNDFSCNSLGVDRGTTVEFEAAFYNRGDIVEDLGKRLGIKGYGDNYCYWPDMNPALLPSEVVAVAEAAASTPEAPMETPETAEPEGEEQSTEGNEQAGS